MLTIKCDLVAVKQLQNSKLCDLFLIILRINSAPDTLRQRSSFNTNVFVNARVFKFRRRNVVIKILRSISFRGKWLENVSQRPSNATEKFILASTV